MPPDAVCRDTARRNGRDRLALLFLQPNETRGRKRNPGVSAGERYGSLNIRRGNFRAGKLTEIFDRLLRLACCCEDRFVVAIQNFEP